MTTLTAPGSFYLNLSDPPDTRRWYFCGYNESTHRFISGAFRALQSNRVELTPDRNHCHVVVYDQFSILNTREYCIRAPNELFNNSTEWILNYPFMRPDGSISCLFESTKCNKVIAKCRIGDCSKKMDLSDKVTHTVIELFF